MEAFSALLARFAGNSPVTSELPSQRPVTRSFDVFFYIYARINDWVNNRNSCGLRRHRAHYDVTNDTVNLQPRKTHVRSSPRVVKHSIYSDTGVWYFEMFINPNPIKPFLPLMTCVPFIITNMLYIANTCWYFKAMFMLYKICVYMCISIVNCLIIHVYDIHIFKFGVNLK